MPEAAIIRETFPVGPLQCNCTILGDPATGAAIVVDPGADARRIVARLAALKLRPVALVHTHAHFDHIGESGRVSAATGAGLRLHEEDVFLYENLDMQGKMFGFKFDAPLPLEGFLRDGDVVGSGRAQLEVLHTPGHTPGSVCFRLATPEGGVVFSGDTLFQGGVGRTDLWGGDFPQLEASIKTRLYALPGDSVVVPGHGPETTVAEERRTNPFVRA